MDQVSITAASGMQARMQALDMLANNLANSATGGFKLDREFYTMVSAHDEDQYDGEGSQTSMPEIKSQWTDFTQGTLQKTGAPLDLALSGQGFFVVNGPKGAMYTRNGGFQLSSKGVLQTSEGYPVSNAGGGNIQTQPGLPITVLQDGTVQQDGQPIGQIAVVDFKERAALQKSGSTYFQNTNSQMKPTPATDAQVAQGQIEQSNVAPAESAVRLVGLLRQFEMLQKAIGVTTDMNKRALDEVAKV